MARKPPNISVRGVKQRIPGGFVVGRDKGDGQAQLLSTKQLRSLLGSSIAEDVAFSGKAIDDRIATRAEILAGTDQDQLGTPYNIAALWEKAADIASASPLVLGDGGYRFVTGVVTIADIDFTTDKAGRWAWLKFAGILQLTHSATLILPKGGSNITTAAGDTALFISEGSDTVRCVVYQRADGTALVAPAGYTDEQAQDTIAGMLQNSSSITWTYNDGANTLTPDVSGEFIEDRIGGIVDLGLYYDDATGSLSVLRGIQIQVTDPNGSAITTGDGKAYLRIGYLLDGYDLWKVGSHVVTTSSSGTVDVQIANVTQAADMLSTKLTIDASEHDSKDAATPAVIDTGNDDCALGDLVRIDVDAAGTGAKGLIVDLVFRKHI